MQTHRVKARLRKYVIRITLGGIMEVTLTSANFEKEVYETHEPVLVDFYADWCGPCRAMGPVVEELAEEYDGKAKICKINIDDNEDIAMQFGVMSIPTFIMFKDGAEATRYIGTQDKSVLKNTLDSLTI